MGLDLELGWTSLDLKRANNFILFRPILFYFIQFYFILFLGLDLKQICKLWGWGPTNQHQGFSRRRLLTKEKNFRVLHFQFRVTVHVAIKFLFLWVLIERLIHCGPLWFYLVMFIPRYYVADKQRFTHTIRGIQGALIISSIFHVCMGFLGIWRFAVRLVSAWHASFLAC